MIRSTKSQQRDSSKPHLHPTHNRRDFANGPMTHDCGTTDVLVNAAFKMEFKIDSKDDLSDE
jgi:hypothetical protein